MFQKERYSPLNPYTLTLVMPSDRVYVSACAKLYTKTILSRVWFEATTACGIGEFVVTRRWRTRCYATSDGPVCHACTRNEAFNNSLELVIKIFVVPMLFICICGEALWHADRRSL